MSTLSLDDLASTAVAPTGYRVRTRPIPFHDALEGPAALAFPWEFSGGLYILAVYPASFRHPAFLHPIPLLTEDERHRLLLRRSFGMYASRDRRPCHPDHPHVTIARATVYFGATTALFHVQQSPFALRPWALLHHWLDFIEMYLADSHQIRTAWTCTAGPRYGAVTTFWKARGYRSDSLVPARLIKALHPTT